MYTPTHPQAELEQRELDVANREDDATQVVYKKNWPRCYPLVDHTYHPIPSVQRKIVAWVGYILWYIFSVVLVFNFFTSIITLFAPGKADLFSNIWFIVFAFLIMILGIPCHFVLSYWPLYKAMRHGNVPRYCIFFVGYALPVLFCLFAIGGWYNYGVGGIVAVIQYWPTVAGSDEDPSYVAFVPNLILAFLWGGLGIAFLIVFIVVILLFRRQKHTLKDVQQLASDSTRDAVNAVTSRLGQAAVNSMVSRGNTQTDSV